MLRHLICLVVPTAIASPVVLNAQAPIWIWATGFEGSGYVQLFDIAESSNNGCFALGWFDQELYLPFDTLVSGNGDLAYFIAHLDTLGATTWAAQFSDRIVSMHGLTNGGLSCLIPYVGSTEVNGQLVNSGIAGHSALVVEFDGTGSITSMVNIPLFLWPGVVDPIRTMHHAEGAGIVVGGSSTDSLFVAGAWLQGSGMFLARLTPQGDLIWAQRIGCGTMIDGSVHIDDQGRILVGVPSGCDPNESDPFPWNGAVSSYSAIGDLEWHQPYIITPLGDVVVMDRRSNGHALTTVPYPIPGGGSEIEVQEFNAVGEPTWSEYVSGTPQIPSYPLSIRATGNGTTLVSGFSAGITDFGPWTVTPNGADGYVASLDSLGSWRWAVLETSGNVYGMSCAPGTNSRIYTTGWTDTGAFFGSHPANWGNTSLTGFVACLGDVILSTSDGGALSRTLSAWPDPAANVLQISLNVDLTQLVSVTDIRGRSVTDHIGRLSPSSFDISRLSPGIYVLSAGEQRIRFVKE
ncbi:MAG: hypothetical protein ABI432_12945 [Flavobacteriales bacterium]